MHKAVIGDPHEAVPWLAVDDEELAGRSAAKLLITASTREGVERLARRVHRAGLRAGFPFVQTTACDLSTEPETLREQCGNFLDAAAGGSLLISDVEGMPPVVQNALIDLLAALECERRPSATVRLISGTTESLLDRVNAGAFSERLFYHLNSIHLMSADSRVYPAVSQRDRWM
jgi:DNA-binding NtrC family response regulator